MSEVINTAIERLTVKLGDGSFDGTAKFVITDHGSIVIDASGIHASDDDTDVTLIASADVFQDILEGNLNPTMAFMSGKLKISGDMGMAMRLGSILG